MQPDLSKLLSLTEEMAGYRRLADQLRLGGKSASATLPGAAKPYVIVALYRALRLPMLVVTARPEDSKHLHEQISAWCGSSRVEYLSGPDALPYERVVSDSSTEMERVRVLSLLSGCGTDEAGDAPPLVVASAPALISKTADHGDFASTCHVIKVGMNIEPLQLLGRWESIGYKAESIVEVPGTMSHRGGIIDIYPPTGELPARLEFFGNTVDNIRLFDPANQRSVKTVASLAISPAAELLAPLLKSKTEVEQVLAHLDLSGCSSETSEQLKQAMAMMLERQRPHEAQFYAALFNHDSLLRYLPGNALLVLDEPSNIGRAVEEFGAEAEQMRSEMVERGELPRNFPRPYFNWEEMKPELAGRRCLGLTAWGAGEDHLGFTSAPTSGGQLPQFIKKMKALLFEKRLLVVVSQQASRLSELLEAEDIMAAPLNELKESPLPGSLALVQGSLAEGWVIGGDTYLFTDAEIFGFVKQRRLVKRRPVPRHKLFVDVSPGDYVVHIEHGIGKFTGVTTLSSDSGGREYLVLQYAAGDKLYVPTDQIDRVSRYIGASDQPPVLSRLGTQEWTHAKQRAREATEALAQELLALYAAREVVPGFAFSPDTVWQQELETSFPYVETPDQMEAQREVKEDMEKPKPMDRLVCGDVGYGKTEVAIRAAFKAVMDGKQVAVLVPTTVLAEQHYLTFSERMKAFPVRVEVLSRFKSPKEQRAILDGLASGAVDICIGTHRLLQKDVVFKDLGLLIIDEEQRFGVAHKEHFKKMRQAVDVLALSATPIPRTLHMSLAGVRDMSTMETPPEERLPIKTYVSEYNERFIREAILRELERNGQAFFVHNRVQSIGLVAAQLEALVPEARVAVAHGQMHEDELEAVMADFSRGNSDVLVCTTIIESGLDMPNVNTLIINQADRLGLSQLYQLRGRVGRGANLAYAYFLYDKEKRLTPTAEKRLRTIYEATELGAGFTIAIKDLEIRGAGTLLGAKQSGHISAIGFDLYTRLLAEAVEQQKARLAGKAAAPKRLPPPTIDLPLSALIPDDYVPDLNTRLGLYQKLVKIETPEQGDGMAQELIDRFGALPDEVKNLLYAIRIKALAARAGIESISTEEGQVVIRLFQGMTLDRQKLAPLARDGIKLGTAQLSLTPKRLGKDWQKVLEAVLGRMG